MESWGSHVLPPDSLSSSSKHSSVLGELRASPPSFLTNDSMFTSSLPVNTGQALVNLGFQDAPMKRVLGDSVLDALPWGIGRGSHMNGCVTTSGVAAGNGFPFVEEDSSLRLSGSVMDPSPLIDLKLGRLADQSDGHCSRPSGGTPMVSTSEPSNPSKRCRADGLGNQAVYCLVYGCNKDLTPSKEYYKRHKVCEVHSKTPKVIVSGKEQRFCQQCSRFHLLGEFDDGKRSCRKRLAGHNERRRKPRVAFHSSGRAAGFLLPLNVGMLYGPNDWTGHSKLEAGIRYGPLPLGSFESRDLHPRLPFSSPSTEELCSFQESNRDSLTTVCLINNSTRYSGPSQMFNRDPSLGTEEFDTIFDTESPIPGSSGISERGCARSLLSSLSQNSCSHASGIPLGQQSLSQHTAAQVSDSFVENGVSRRLLGSVEGSQAGPGVVSDGDSVSFEISNEILHGSVFANVKGHLLDEEAPTIDLLQLSSQLQRVEHERQYMKLEFDSPECVRTT